MDLLPESIYGARARTWTFRESKVGNWYLRVDYALVDPAHANQRVSGNLHFNSDQQWRVSLAVIRALGGETDEPQDYVDNAGSLDRNLVRVVVRHEPFGDRFVAVVDRVLLPTQDEGHERLQEFLRARRPLPATKKEAGSGNL